MPRTTKAQLQEELQQQQWQSTLLQERILELEQDDLGWQHITEGWDAFEFSRQFLGEIVRLSRIMALKNPLIRHYVRLQSHYVWGQGINIQAADEQVNTAIHDLFWDLPDNRVALTGTQALKAREREYSIVGNIFFVLFSDPATGAVHIRSIPFEEVKEIICNPDDACERWYYKRVWTQKRFNEATGLTENQEQTAWYPDWRYNPPTRRGQINGKPVLWDSPVYHMRDTETGDMQWGVPSTYAALDWAKAVKTNLEDHATLVRALARFAWHFPVGSGRGVAAVKSTLGTTIGIHSSGLPETNPPPVTGAAWIGPNAPEPIRTAGATPNPDASRRLWLMVAAAVGIPETILAGDADVGNLATAKTLDRPTELQMVDRQESWKESLGDIIGYAIQRIQAAPGGPLSQGVDTHVDIDFPPLLERDQNLVVDAIIKAHGTGRLTPELISRLLLDAFGVDDADEEMEKIEQMDREIPQLRPGERPPEDETQEEREARVSQTLRGIDAYMRGVYGNGHQK